MSIIHEALKKAAAEGTSETFRSASHGHLFRASARMPQAYRWMTIGLSLSAIALFFFSVRYPLLRSGQLATSVDRSRPPSFDSQISSEAPRPNQALAGDKKRDHSEIAARLPEESQAEGERLLSAGMKLYREGKVAEAGEAFSKAVQLLPSSSVAHNNLGMVLRHQGKTDEAFRHYREAIRIDPGYAEAENNIGLLYDKTGSIDQAAVHYKRAIEINPTVALFHLNYATLLERKGDFTNARKEYQRYLDLEADQKSETFPLVRSHLDRLKGF